MRPLVSLIIPCFNAEPRLAHTLKSVLRQSWRPIEIVFVDNNSTDGSLALARAIAKDADVPFVVLECKEQGAGHARAMGFERSSGEYIQWLDADDELDPRKVELQVEALEADPSADVAYGSWEFRWFDGDRLDAAFPFTALQRDDMIHRFLVDEWGPCGGYLVRRKLAQRLHDLDGWHRGVRVGDDRQYFAYAAILGARFVAVPDSRVFYNVWSSKQLTRAVPMAEKHQALTRMFDNFRALAAQQAAGAIRDEHRALLELPRDLFVIAEDRARARATENTKVGIVARTLGDEEMWRRCWILDRDANILEILAIGVVRRLWTLAIEATGQGSPETFDAHAVLGHLHDMLGLAPLAAGDPLPSTNVPYARIDEYPPPSPLLCDYRVPVLHILDELRRDGVLVSCTP